MTARKRVCWWIRTDLRLHDNPALQAALDLEPEALYPIWTWDPHYLRVQRVGPNRWRFLLDSMKTLNDNIKKINPKSQLFVLRASPQTIWPKLFKKWDITHLVFEKDDCPYTKARDEAVTKAAEAAGVQVIQKVGHTLFWAEDVVKANKGKPPLAYGAFVKLVEGIGNVPKPILAPKNLPDPGTTDITGLGQQDQGLDAYKGIDNNAPSRKSDDKGYDKLAGPRDRFSVPTMQEIGMKDATSPHRGGEDEALRRLDDFLQDKEAVISFEKPKTDPSAFEPASTTILSPYLKFGCLSPRTFYFRLKEVIDKHPSHSKPPVSLIGQLYWREMCVALLQALYSEQKVDNRFHTAMYTTSNWNQMRGNPIARYIDWRYENQYDQEGNRLPMDQWQLDEQDEFGKTLFTAWRVGRTGYPWIDAIMRQLRQEGWIHHLARHAVACFLTRGHCYVSWERGQEVFDEFLVDWDPAMNGGNWMWLSCTAFFSQYYRVYSPVAFGKKQRNGHAYVRRYVPEVANFPDKYLFEPWKAPQEVQRKAQCIVGEDYPKPIVTEDAKTHVIDKIKSAYGMGMHGDHQDVLNGSAKRKLRDAMPLDKPSGDDSIPEPPVRETPSSSARKRQRSGDVKQSEDDVKRHGKQAKLAFDKE